MFCGQSCGYVIMLLVIQISTYITVSTNVGIYGGSYFYKNRRKLVWNTDENCNAVGMHAVDKSNTHIQIF